MWDKKYKDELNAKRQAAIEGGGQVRIRTQHEHGKLTARERINILFDDGTFEEIGTYREARPDKSIEKYTTYPGDGVVTGFGKINGKLVFACSEDFTVIGGTLGEVHSKKICLLQDMALKAKAPIVFINDSGGARIEDGINSIAGYSGIFLRNTQASGVIPQIAVILGPCAGGACYSPAICDFVFMAKQNSRMFITGPVVVKAAIHEDVSADQLGDADVHSSKSGVAHFIYDDDEQCLNGVRNLLAYLPQNNDEKPECFITEAVDDCSKIENIVPDNMRLAYNVKDVIKTFIDRESFLEVQDKFAPNAVTGFARLNGKTIGIVANQPMVFAGILDINSSDKIARFVRFCDCFNIPLLTMVDVPGFMPGSQQEHNGIIRHGAKILFAYSEATVPKVTLIMRKAYGGAYIAMNSKNMGADIVFSWPIAQIAVMGPEGAVDILYKKTISTADNPEARRKKLVEEYENTYLNPYFGAANGYIDEIIAPEDTKEKICEAFMMLENKNRDYIAKRHGNIPL